FFSLPLPRPAPPPPPPPTPPPPPPRADSPPVRAWVGALAHADAQGMSLGPMLRGLATRYRAERHQRAERLAMEAPVKMLLPLIACIFPCTFIVLAFPIGYALLQGGP
ncbi:type II secretion system F family protein, partial [Bordetella pertussis]|uniref:type II secretion system F family protein n=1 Tax=Bordetella pertussis TaxID=520 RepID=UPI00366F789A